MKEKVAGLRKYTALKEDTCEQKATRIYDERACFSNL